MSKFAVFNENGFPVAFYSIDVHGDNIPKDAIEITDEQWLEFLGHQGLRLWDGEKVVVYAPPPPPEPTPEELRALMPSITKRQLRLTLVRNGISLSELDAAILSMGDEAIIEWQDASEYRRLHPLLLQVAAYLELTPEQIDVMWQEALEA